MTFYIGAGVVVIAIAIVVRFLVRRYRYLHYLRTTDWAVLQARPIQRPAWWPEDADGKAEWATCYADGNGHSMHYSTAEAIPVDEIEELEEEWLELHEGEWEFRSQPCQWPCAHPQKGS